MKKISSAVETVVAGHPALAFGLHHRLLNLTQLARYLRPSVAAQTHKDVSESAILMSLSRLQRKWARSRLQATESLVLDKVSIVSGLCSVTLAKTQTTHRELNRVFTSIQERNGFITITEGLQETTVIVEEENFSFLRKALSSRPKIVNRSLASVGMSFQREVFDGEGRPPSAPRAGGSPEHQCPRSGLHRDRVLHLRRGEGRGGRFRGHLSSFRAQAAAPMMEATKSPSFTRPSRAESSAGSRRRGSRPSLRDKTRPRGFLRADRTNLTGVVAWWRRSGAKSEARPRWSRSRAGLRLR